MLEFQAEEKFLLFSIKESHSSNISVPPAKIEDTKKQNNFPFAYKALVELFFNYRIMKCFSHILEEIIVLYFQIYLVGLSY